MGCSDSRKKNVAGHGHEFLHSKLLTVFKIRICSNIRVDQVVLRTPWSEGREDRRACVLNFGTMHRWMISFTLRPLYLPYSLEHKLTGTRSQYVVAGKRGVVVFKLDHGKF
jgi:hypothetical protein